MNIADLVKQSGLLDYTKILIPEYERFAQLVIEAHTQELIGVEVEPDTHCFDDDTQTDVWSYSKEMLAAAVLRERARIAEYLDRNLMSAREYAEAIRKGGSDAN